MTDNLAQLLNIHELYWKGKNATEIFLVIVPVFLILLMLFGHFIGGKKVKSKNTNKTVKILLPFVVLMTVLNTSANAMCPVCTVAIGAGLGVSRVLGIDDFTTSIWMGGLVVSTINWILSWLEKRKIKSAKVTVATYLVMYALVFIPLWMSGTIGVKGNFLFGIDKVLLGIIVGTVFFIIGMLIHNSLKKKNNSVNYIPFQKVVLPISFIWIATLIAYYIIYYVI